MAVKASASITLTSVVDIQATYRYYLLQSSTLAKPSVPTAYPPGGSWTDAEPTYTSGSTKSLYYVDLTVFSNGSFKYGAVSLSTAYEAAKEAYNKAQNAQDAVDNIEIGSRNLIRNSINLLYELYSFGYAIVSYTNLVRTSIDSDGSIYNGTGYKNGYRIRSGGAEGALNTAACTGFIKVKAGDTIRISGCEFFATTNGNAINVCDSTFATVGQTTKNSTYGYGEFEGAWADYQIHNSCVEESAGIYKWIVPPVKTDPAYIRISGYNSSGGNGAALIVTVNEPIE